MNNEELTSNLEEIAGRVAALESVVLVPLDRDTLETILEQIHKEPLQVAERAF